MNRFRANLQSPLGGMAVLAALGVLTFVLRPQTLTLTPPYATSVQPVHRRLADTAEHPLTVARLSKYVGLYRSGHTAVGLAGTPSRPMSGEVSCGINWSPDGTRMRIALSIKSPAGEVTQWFGDVTFEVSSNVDVIVWTSVPLDPSQQIKRETMAERLERLRRELQLNAPMPIAPPPPHVLTDTLRNPGRAYADGTTSLGRARIEITPTGIIIHETQGVLMQDVIAPPGQRVALTREERRILPAIPSSSKSIASATTSR
jgi:hypothetical protein